MLIDPVAQSRDCWIVILRNSKPTSRKLEYENPAKCLPLCVYYNNHHVYVKQLFTWETTVKANAFMNTFMGCEQSSAILPARVPLWKRVSWLVLC